MGMTAAKKPDATIASNGCKQALFTRSLDAMYAMALDINSSIPQI